ncbi:MAG: protease inhibitor I42 family protein, partial [Phycisphaerae bacterium]|nr:protease inhibitor I42 family protein [Phycisphaerae bacterium]
ELDKSHNGKTVSATVGQEIIIRLKSNPTTGYQWVVGKIEGDALGQIGLVKYEQRKHGPGMVGVGGKEVFTFRTTKAGTAKLILEYKGPGKVIARTFTLTVNVKPAPAKHSAPYLRALELDDPANGKTVSAIVGQKIIVRLKGAPVPGRMWGPAKLEGDAIEQVGQMKFVPDARPKPRPVFVPGPGHQQPGPVPGARPQPMAGGLVAHTMGGPGKYVFTFRAVKAGKAEVTIKGRVHRARRPVRTFTLTMAIKADPTAERVKKLKANLGTFMFHLRYHGKQDQNKPFYRLTLDRLPRLPTPKAAVRLLVRVNHDQAEKIIDHLARSGFLASAMLNTPQNAMPDGPAYTYLLTVDLKDRKGGWWLYEDLGWDLKMLKRLDGLRKVLDGDAAKEMDKLLKRLEGQREEWGKAAKPGKIDLKKSATYKSDKWQYHYEVKRPGTRHEGYWGRLFYNGKEITGLGAHNIGLNDYYQTPWGKIYWVHLPEMRQGPHGWMPQPSPYSKRKGRLLSSPEKSTPKPAKIDLKKSGTYKSGKWEYRYWVWAGPPARGRKGRLFYNGKEIKGYEGNIGRNDYYQTPWGKIYWAGLFYMQGGSQGWLPWSPGIKLARLLPSPGKFTSPGSAAALELDESHNGKTVSAVVGQEIVIRLKGNATTGYSWVVGKIEGDALGQVGKVKYVSDDPPRLVPGRGRRIMRHRVGGGGKYVFTFRATKAGTAKLSLEYKRGWEKNKPAARTFTLTLLIKPNLATERAEKLKTNLDKKDFELVLRYHGPKGDSAYMSLGLVWSRQTVRALGKGGGGKRPAPADIRVVAVAGKPNPNVMRLGDKTYVRITKKQDIIKIIAHLADEGFLGKARDITGAKIKQPGGPLYSMQVNSGKTRLHEYLGWDLKMLNRLDGLRKVLDGDAAKAMDKLLKRLEGQRKEWEKSASVKPQAGKDARGVTGK